MAIGDLLRSKGAPRNLGRAFFDRQHLQQQLAEMADNGRNLCHAFFECQQVPNASESS